VATPLLALRDISWKVGGLDIVRDVNLDIHDNEFLSIIGPNGAGKSSLVNLLSGVRLPSAGSIRLRDMDIAGLRDYRRARLGIGRTFQTSSLFGGLSVSENLRLALQASRFGPRSQRLISRAATPVGGPRAAAKPEARGRDVGSSAQVKVWLDRVGLSDQTMTAARALSHGDQRKLEVAMVLCQRPRILVMDEPTAGVAADEVYPLVELFRTAHRTPCTVVMVEHRMDVVSQVSDRIAVMHHGRLLTVGSPDQVMADPVVRQSYLGEDAL
jgi:branched-chain amino acid transport system ATP-binding protein